ncbi:integrase arm-type DNA-binding domain-containing protein [uncultured Cohaesibacter sp.]|uniref:tyrosine-type recombinase/integrase n=1 Tax=uncultured Cohaesibacter sp. TaxID=1002546 RepID=UPI00293071AA|nr:integrase arm-type DNA-binding domain-containing protein [uncultured Cohaesibacter sp.]
MLGSKLSAVFVRSVKEPGKYHDKSGTGLFLRDDKSGAKFWIQRITIHGKRRELGLGSFPIVTLAEARDKAFENKRSVYNGGDPLTDKQAKKGTITFSDAVDKYLAAKEKEFRNDKHKKQWRSTLESYAVPVLGKMDVKSIRLPDVLRVLEPIWEEKTETASRLRGRIESVLSWATVAGYREGENPARWKGNLSEILPKPSKVAKTGNQPAIALADIPAWWDALNQRQGMAASALQFLSLTLARSGEVRGATWDEIDLKAKDGPVWIIPATRMKAAKEHRVPLPNAAVKLLKSLPTMENSPYVFFAPKGGQMSDMSLSAVMRRMHQAETEKGNTGWLDPRSKRPAVPHGLRSSFRDWAAERGYERDLAEISLAHKVGSEVERAYRRSDMLQRRRAVLDAWSQFLMGKEVSGSVVPRRSPTSSH